MIRFSPEGVLARTAALTGLAMALSLPAQAVVNGQATSSYSAVGKIGGTSGVQIAANWVLTAAHVGAGVQENATTFASVAGSAVIDEVYLVSAGGEFPNNDLALLHLATAIDTAALPVLNDQLLNAIQASRLGRVTIVSAQNGEPNDFGVATAKTAMTTQLEDGKLSTVNWLITQGDAHVQGGDSGGALFKGTPADSGGSVLLGIASASVSYPSGDTVSAFVQPYAYKSWINDTMAGSGQQALWSSSAIVNSIAQQSVVPEPGTGALSVLFGLMALASPGVRRQITRRG